VRIVAKQLELIAVNANFVKQTQAGGFRQRREGLRLSLVLRTPMDRAAEAHGAEFDEFDLSSENCLSDKKCH
jgi:hypothetical protein